jgi:outer membrane protein assembly factor BamD
MVLGLILFVTMSPSSAQQISELRGGRWVDLPPESVSATQPALDPTLLHIEELLRQGRNGDARKQVVTWLKANRNSPVYDRGLFLMAEGLYQYGDRIKSYYYLDQLMDEYPDSPLFYRALEKQYQIADGFLNGYKTRFLRIPMFSAEDEAIEMLFRIRERSPGSPLAEQALLRTADYYYADAQYDLAEDAYRAYATSYPRSPYVPRVALREAYSNLAQFRGLRFDATPALDAKVQLQDIAAKYPDLAAEENVAGLLDRIDNTFARKLSVTADFYRRTHQPRASMYTYEHLLKNYPNTPEAVVAQEQLRRLEAAYPAARPSVGPTTAPILAPLSSAFNP